MTYTTIQGDAFDLIAKRVYGDEKAVRPLLEANPQHAETILFPAGVVLAVPERPPGASDNPPPWRRSS